MRYMPNAVRAVLSTTASAWALGSRALEKAFARAARRRILLRRHAAIRHAVRLAPVRSRLPGERTTLH